MTQEQTTFIGWVESHYREILNARPRDPIAYSLDDPDNPSQLLEVEPQTVFEDGDYSMDEKMFQAIELMGQDMKNIAEQQGIDLTKFSDLKTAFGYDTEPNDLSAAELGSYVVGVFMTDSTMKGHSGGIQSILEATEIIPRGHQFTNDAFINKVELGQELGKQVYGDNSLETSSTDTTTENSMNGIKELLPNPR